MGGGEAGKTVNVCTRQTWLKYGKFLLRYFNLFCLSLLLLSLSVYILAVIVDPPGTAANLANTKGCHEKRMKSHVYE